MNISPITPFLTSNNPVISVCNTAVNYISNLFNILSSCAAADRFQLYRVHSVTTHTLNFLKCLYYNVISCNFPSKCVDSFFPLCPFNSAHLVYGDCCMSGNSCIFQLLTFMNFIFLSFPFHNG